LRQASIRAEQGRVDEAIAMVDAIHAADQDEQLIGVLTLSQILRKAERYEQAIERLEAANEEIPDSVEIQYELGMLLERESRHEDMEKYLRQVIELDPGYAHAYNALGYSLADRGVRLKEAHELIARAHQILPEDPYILDSLGWVKFRLGENKAAEKYLRQAYQISPEAEIAAHLGELLWVTGRRAEAREVWAQGQSLDAKDPALLDTLAATSGSRLDGCLASVFEGVLKDRFEVVLAGTHMPLFGAVVVSLRHDHTRSRSFYLAKSGRVALH